MNLPGMPMWHMKEMAPRLDRVFPEAGGLENLRNVRIDFLQRVQDRPYEENGTFFRPEEVEHVKEALEALGDNEEAKATLMSVIAFAQMKSDVARLG